MNYIGIDIGDGESAVARYDQGSSIEPVILPVCGEQSILSAVGMHRGETVIGAAAYTDALAEQLSVRFKSRYTRGGDAERDMLRFVRTLVAQLEKDGQITDDTVCTLGCPAGWDAACRSRYRALMLRAGIPDPHLISESRAAFLYAKYARTIALDVDILEESALVVDIGSSTLDFAYIVDGRESSIGTFGETALGGGILDAAILRRAVQRCKNAERVQRVFDESRSWYSYCEIETRRAKEEYYTALAAQGTADIHRVIRLYYDGVQKIELNLNDEEMEDLIRIPLPELGGRSFTEALRDALRNARSLTTKDPAKTILLTGGASRMPFFHELCREAFPEAQVICCPEPEFSIAKGLAYAGWVEENLKAFRQEIADTLCEEKLKDMALKQIPELVPPLAAELSLLILDNVVIPCTQSWQRGEIATLDLLKKQIGEMIPRILNSDAAREVMTPVITAWMSRLTGILQQAVYPICDRYRVPRRQMTLTLVARSPQELGFDPEKMMGVNIVATFAGVVLSLISATICGGSGLALISAGPVGTLAGAAIGGVLALIGQKPLTDSLMKVSLPRPLRKLPVTRGLKSGKCRQELQDTMIREWVPATSSFAQSISGEFAASFARYIQSTARNAEVPIE